MILSYDGIYSGLLLMGVILIPNIAIIYAIDFWRSHYKNKLDNAGRQKEKIIEQKAVYKISYSPDTGYWVAKYCNDPSPMPIAKGDTFEEAEKNLGIYIKRKRENNFESFYDVDGWDVFPGKN